MTDGIAESALRTIYIMTGILWLNSGNTMALITGIFSLCNPSGKSSTCCRENILLGSIAVFISSLSFGCYSPFFSIMQQRYKKDFSYERNDRWTCLFACSVASCCFMLPMSLGIQAIAQNLLQRHENRHLVHNYEQWMYELWIKSRIFARFLYKMLQKQ